MKLLRLTGVILFVKLDQNITNACRMDVFKSHSFSKGDRVSVEVGKSFQIKCLSRNNNFVIF